MLAILLNTQPSSGQATTGRGSIAGTVVDAESSLPLLSASVRLLEAHRTVPTHADGGFAFASLPPGRYTMTVEHLGYRTVTRAVTVRPDSVARVRIELSVAAIQLGEIVVTGALTARSKKELLSPASVVGGADLDRKVDATVAATIQRQPGISVASSGPATARPVIRGLGGDRILVLEDGQRPGDLSSTSGDHAVAVDPLTAKQVEVVRGPMSLLYGSSALGGVVNIVREEVPTSLPEHLHGAFSVQGASVNRGGTAGGHVTGATRNWSLRGEGTVRGSGDTSTPDGPLDNTESRTFNTALGIARIGKSGHAGASYRFYDNTYGIPGGLGEHDEDEEPEEHEEHAAGVDIAMRRHTVRMEAEKHREERLFNALRLTGTFTDYQHSEMEGDGEVGTEFSQTLASLETLARHGPTGRLTQGAIGVRAQYRDILTGGSLQTPSTYDYNAAVFAVEEIEAGPLKFQLGARYDWAHYVPRDTTAFVFAGNRRIPVRPRTFGSVSGSAGILFTANEKVRVGGSVSRAYRTPDFNELYTNGPHLAANSYDVGDPGLQQETGLGIDIFARYDGSAVRGEVAVFRNQLSDFIFPSSRGRTEIGSEGTPRFQYTNENARFVGAEGDLEWSITPRWVLDGTLSWVQAEFTTQREPIPVFQPSDTVLIPASKYPPFIPPLNGQLGLRYEERQFFASAGLRFAAEQTRLGDFEEPTDGYSTGFGTIGVRYYEAGRFHTLTLRVDNITNVSYRDHLSRVKEIMPEPGRNVSLLYRVSF